MKNSNKEYDWDEVLSAASRLQGLVREAVLVGGTASALFAGHRTSYDADHIIPNLRQNFDEVLASLEVVAGWQTARVKRPVLILGSLDGIETGVRQLIRTEPLETTEIFARGEKIVVPTEGEILRIKGALILKRNATRDYLDFAALSKHLGNDASHKALEKFDVLYPQPNGESALQQLYLQLANPHPFDLREVNLSTYRNLSEYWQNWDNVLQQCQQTACNIVNHSDHLAIEQQAEEIKNVLQHLANSVTTYDDTLKNYMQAKSTQADRLEAALAEQVDAQRARLSTTNAQRPGRIASLWSGQNWQKQQQAQQVRLKVLESRLSRVQTLRLDSKKIAIFAEKKLRRVQQELTAHRDAALREKREKLAQEQGQRLSQSQGKSQSRGRTHTLDI